jgi:phosphate uptake regulator/aminoglycoside phosphotransferase (APT) family kinase protein
MLSLGAVDENLHFLILEVIRQVERTRTYLQNPSEKLLQAILTRDDYIDHLRTIIQRKCFELAREADLHDRFEIELLKSLDLITGNLERIADFCESIVGQFAYLRSQSFIDELRVADNLDALVDGLEKVESALDERDVHAALEICRIEHALDELYARTFGDILRRLDEGGDAQSHVTSLFIAHYFERMGDSMLNIGEAILSAALGERIKIDQFRALRESMEDTGAFEAPDPADLVSIEALGETRSGCRIDRVSDRTGHEERMVVFKEGAPDKLLEEKRCIDRWNETLPGFAPEVYSFQERGDSGAILFEYIAGRTFEELVLRSHPQELRAAMVQLESALLEIWSRTRIDEPVFPNFVAQLATRLKDVYELHPEFRTGTVQFGGLEVMPFGDLVERGRRLDALLSAPFSILGHGDLNVDNVIYDHARRSIRFIDLHRSRDMDYTQDVSVFLVSYFRLQVFDRPVRRRIQQVISRLHDFAREFAVRSDDPTFEARLATGLARSFASSARFVLDEEFAKSLFYRGRFLLEQLIDWPEHDFASYRVPGEILVD